MWSRVCPFSPLPHPHAPSSSTSSVGHVTPPLSQLQRETTDGPIRVNYSWASWTDLIWSRSNRWQHMSNFSNSNCCHWGSILQPSCWEADLLKVASCDLSSHVLALVGLFQRADGQLLASSGVGPSENELLLACC